MKQLKKNKHYKTIQSRTKPAKSEYRIILESTDGEEEGGIFMDMADMQIIYKALKQYKPTQAEAQLYDLLLETFEEEIWIDEHGDDET